MKQVKKFAPLAAAVLGFVAVVMIFFASIVLVQNNGFYTGLQVVFGLVRESTLGTKIVIIGFNFFNLLPYLFAIAGIVVCLLNFLGKGKPVFVWIAVGCFALAALFFFLTIPLFWAPTFEGGTAAEIDELKAKFLALGVGPIVSGICSILAALATATPFVLDKLGK